MRYPYYNGYLLEARRLYKTLHDFMKNEVAELTPEEKEK